MNNAKEGSPLFTRRAFLTTTVSTVAGLAAAEFGIPIKNLYTPSEFENHPVIHTPTYYNNESLHKTHIVACGDSIARGHLDTSSIPHPAADSIFKRMNTLLGRNETNGWFWHNRAGNGATAKDTLARLHEPSIFTGIPKDASVDILVSVGANDIREFVTAQWSDLETIMEHPKSLALARFAYQLQQAMHVYEKSVLAILQTFQSYKNQGIPIQRIFVLGTPNAALAEELTLSNGNSISIRGDTLKEILAQNLSMRTNIEMISAIDVISPQMRQNGIDIVFLDTFHALQNEHFTSMHPNETGQEKIADLYLQRGQFQLPNGTVSTLFEQTVKPT